MSSTSQPLTARVAANIRSARAAAGLTQRQLALRIDVDPMIVSKWERGAHCPSDSNLALLAAEFACDLGWFFSEPVEEPAA